MTLGDPDKKRTLSIFQDAPEVSPGRTESTLEDHRYDRASFFSALYLVLNFPTDSSSPAIVWLVKQPIQRRLILSLQLLVPNNQIGVAWAKKTDPLASPLLCILATIRATLSPTYTQDCSMIQYSIHFTTLVLPNLSLLILASR